MALIAIAADKGAPGVTTTALALASVWPRPVLLAECDPAGGDLAYRFPAASGGNLDPRRGVLSLGVAARRGIAPNQVWEHVQKLYGGLDVLTGVTNAEQGTGLNVLWGQIGRVLANVPQADVIADCGRLGAEGPVYDLLAEAAVVLLVSRTELGDVIRLRDRATAFAAAASSRGRRGFGAAVLFVADRRKFASVRGEIDHVLKQTNVPVGIVGAIAHDPKGAALFGGAAVGKLGSAPLIKSAREVAQQLVAGLPGQAAAPGQSAPAHPGQVQAGQPAAAPPQAAPNYSPPQPQPQPHVQPQPQPQPQPSPPPQAQGRHQAAPETVPAVGAGTGPQQTQLRPVASGARHATQPSATQTSQPAPAQAPPAEAIPAPPAADNWFSADRQKQHEPQQSGGE
jgi:MinD-like ATPase involved in chromosome partitioning or flagellar assembly